ncbi:hypothetical protein DUNSADRAFT_16059, partial [Dunaliella salina]
MQPFLRKPVGTLFDPRVPALRAVLDPCQSFPAAPFDAPPILDGMRSLGLQAQASLQVLAAAAESISASYHDKRSCSASTSPAFERLQQLDAEEAQLVARARALLYLLDSKAMADPHFCGLDTAGGGKASGSSHGGLWGRLQSLSWCPVLQEPPEDAACFYALVHALKSDSCKADFEGENVVCCCGHCERVNLTNFVSAHGCLLWCPVLQDPLLRMDSQCTMLQEHPEDGSCALMMGAHGNSGNKQ